jgi:hypothetical protein
MLPLWYIRVLKVEAARLRPAATRTRLYHHKHHSSVEPGLAGGVCAQYQDNSCCNADKIHANSSYTNASFLLNIYGEKYAHDRCGPISAQCEALLVEENCGYECDVNWGRYRHKAVACGEAGTNHYEWQVSGLPIEVSTAFLSCYHSMQYCLPGCKRCPCYPLESNRTHQSWGCPSGLRQPSLVEPFEPDPDHSGGGKLVLPVVSRRLRSTLRTPAGSDHVCHHKWHPAVWNAAVLAGEIGLLHTSHMPDLPCNA